MLGLVVSHAGCEDGGDFRGRLYPSFGDFSWKSETVCRGKIDKVECGFYANKTVKAAAALCEKLQCVSKSIATARAIGWPHFLSSRYCAVFTENEPDLHPHPGAFPPPHRSSFLPAPGLLSISRLCEHSQKIPGVLPPILNPETIFVPPYPFSPCALSRCVSVSASLFLSFALS